MSVEKHTLSNGATVLIDHMPEVKSAALGYFFRVGSRFETRKENGLAHFLEHMAFKGTPSRGVYDLAIEMDDLGAMSNAFTSKEGTCYYMAGAADDIFSFNKLVSDIAINMSLPADELERERGAILEEIKMYADKPNFVLNDASDAVMFPGQAYGRTILGPPENIKSFDRSIFEKFRSKHYHAGNLIVSVAGNVDPAKILQDIEDATAGMPTGKRSRYQRASFHGGEVHITQPTKQINLQVTFAAGAIGKSENAAEAILLNVLGGGMSSRLFTEVREKRGLVYSVGAGASRSFDVGEVGVYAGTSPEKVATLIPVVCDELNKVRQHEVSDEELARAKKRVINSILTSDKSSRTAMVNNASNFNMTGKIVEPDALVAKFSAVTKADVLAAAQRLFSGKPMVSSIGPSGFPSLDEVENRLDI